MLLSKVCGIGTHCARLDLTKIDPDLPLLLIPIHYQDLVVFSRNLRPRPIAGVVFVCEGTIRVGVGCSLISCPIILTDKLTHTPKSESQEAEHL